MSYGKISYHSGLYTPAPRTLGDIIYKTVIAPCCSALDNAVDAEYARREILRGDCTRSGDAQTHARMHEQPEATRTYSDTDTNKNKTHTHTHTKTMN